MKIKYRKLIITQIMTSEIYYNFFKKNLKNLKKIKKN